MDSETVGAIASLTRAAEVAPLTREVSLQGKTFTYRNHATEYGRELGEILSLPKLQPLAVTTLTGFVDSLQANTYDPAAFLVHIEDYLTVSLKMRAVDPFGVRATHVSAKHTPIDAFRFDNYYSDPQKFIIAIQVAFLQTDELLYLIRIASNLKAGNSVATLDDGYSQTVTIKTGEVSTAEVKLPPRIKLIPLRSFLEAAPVESEFLIRLQQTPQQTPSIALFDVDGKKWQGEWMQSIKRWLADKIDSGFPIIA